MKYYTIYKTRNLINGKEYIGKHITENLDDEYLGSGILLSKALKKYKKENFKKEILFVFDNEIDMENQEKCLVTEEYCSRDDTYNILPGGQGGWSYVNSILTKEFRQDIGRQGGIISGNLSVIRKTGIHGMSKEKQLESASKGGKALKGVPKSENMKNKAKEYIWIRNENYSTKLHLDNPIPQGWWRGRIINKQK